MNFIMPGRSGFCEDRMTTAPSSSSPSSSSSSLSPSAAPPPPPPPTPPEDNVGAASSVIIQMEHMFDKVVTPSDVGKLNRLVIPKQHAERYFPLNSSASDKGLLLSFEECRSGKLWRFRYSYWNSSQSYVMTKGWSRFVKEKRLDAGDVVSFQRALSAVEGGSDRRLFIDWRHRPPDAPPIIPNYQFAFHRPSIHPWSPLFIHSPPSRDYSPHFLQASAGYYYSTNHTFSTRNPRPPAAPGILATQQLGIGQTEITGKHNETIFNAVPVVQGKAASAKRLRLFGVNMDCPISESDEYDVLSTPVHNPTLPLLPSPSSSIFAKHSDDGHEDEEKGKGSMSLDLDM